MDTDTPNPLAEATARATDNERRDRQAKDAGRDLLLAVLLFAAPELLPETIRLARERVLATGR
jgi:hypothetical protein